MSKVPYFLVLTIIYFSLVTTLTIAENAKTKMADATQQRNNQGDMDEADVDEIMNKCNETFRVEMSYLEALNETGSFPDETDKTPKCFIRCVLENTGIMSADGNFDPELTVMFLSGEKAGKDTEGLQDMAVTCSDRKETCKCERSYNYLKCLMSMEIEKYQNKN